MDKSIIEVQAKLEEAKSKGLINQDLQKLQKQINKLKLQAEIDPKTISALTKQLETLLNQKIPISNLNLDSSSAIKSAKQTGEKIGTAINQEIAKTNSKASSPITDKIRFSIDTETYATDLLKLEKQLDKYKKQNSETFDKAKASLENLSNLYQRMQSAITNDDLEDSQKIQLESDYQKALLKTKNLTEQLSNSKNIEPSSSDRLKQIWDKLSSWSMLKAGIGAVQDQIRKIPEAVYETDAAMAKLKNVTDETNHTYQEFLDSAGSSAQELGRSVSGLIEQTGVRI